MSHGKFFGRQTNRVPIEWDEYPEDTDLSEDFVEGKEPLRLNPEEVLRGSACGEGGCE